MFQGSSVEAEKRISVERRAGTQRNLRSLIQRHAVTEQQCLSQKAVNFLGHK